MKQNVYDERDFYNAYKEMDRSKAGLEAAGEWHILKKMLPPLKNKTVLDLGCGFGWHCRYAKEQQASRVIGIDISERMLEKARFLTNDSSITYLNMSMEALDFPDEEFDVVISSLALHYVASFQMMCEKINARLKAGGTFIFSVEHPIFTARDAQDWVYDAEENRLYWPVDNYQKQGIRQANFLHQDVIKYHRTVATYINNLIECGFIIRNVEESYPSDEMIKKVPGMNDENRRPMFLMIAATKK